MCGIVGLYLRDAVVQREQIDAMNRTIVHRGPDEDGVFVDGPIGLGMRRLSIIDLEGGRQPIANETSRVLVIQNGEIYNFRELRKELEARGHRFRTRSDTEAAVHAYEEWGGSEFAKHLRGMFAIAIWDADRHELWLVRDRVGIKPLYFAETAAGLAFGSEVKSLLAAPIVRPELEPRALCEYLTFGHAGLDGSFIRNVRPLRPGRVLRFDGCRTQIQAYWELPSFSGPRQIEEREAAEVLRERFQETVRAHLVSDVPVGAFLSGGVDSSSVVAMMARAGCANIKTFSIGFAEDEFNELPFAQRIADRFGTEHHSELVNPGHATSIVERLIAHFDEPFADASAVATWYVSQLAAQEVKVVLTGDGGDELFAGYTRYAEVRRDAWLDRIPMAARRACACLAGFLPHSFPGKYFLDYAAHNQAGRYVYNGTLMPLPLRRTLLRPEWHPERLGVDDPLDEPLRLMGECGVTDPVAKCMFLDTLHYLPCDILVKVDRMTMAHSLEARPPLLDHEFLEFVASLPLEWKFSRNGAQKHIFKRAMAPFVPNEIMGRRKAGFALPLQSWFAGPLAPILTDCVLVNGLSSEYIDPKAVGMLFEENRRGRRDHGLRLWALLVFELWLRGLTGANHARSDAAGAVARAPVAGASGP